ncbi:hypothetical protein QLL95_gp0516 [Cotonvirus japonicus]|uniref:MSV199 domain-containing protein n=1 Tax=Cotonvirus japonicus TaxID=2811091 RepID=A0ABM7NU70_9VIRU|nr:hypothetical protein QLL95_gp0516 [Cotonvirus japonicus]BCS83607.1 hypothetical protein [Cotonvirus japonicus]
MRIVKKYWKLLYFIRARKNKRCGYYFIRIKPGEFSKKELINYIDKEINNYQLIYSSKIDPEVLWKELKDTSIDRQFFDFIGTSIVSTKKYCVNFDDIILFVGYGQKIGAVRKLMNNYRENVDFVDLNYDEMKVNESVSNLSDNKPSHGGHKKRCIFLTKFAAYSFIIECQTVRAKEIRSHVIDVYNKYHDLLVFCKQKNHQNNYDKAKNNAVQLYNKRQDKKHSDYVQNKQREIKSIRQSVDEIRRQKDDINNKNIVLEHELNKYKNLLHQSENLLDKFKSEMKQIASECPDKNLKHKLIKKINSY